MEIWTIVARSLSGKLGIYSSAARWLMMEASAASAETMAASKSAPSKAMAAKAVMAPANAVAPPEP